jgi:hypothetical protein
MMVDLPLLEQMFGLSKDSTLNLNWHQSIMHGLTRKRSRGLTLEMANDHLFKRLLYFK